MHKFLLLLVVAATTAAATELDQATAFQWTIYKVSHGRKYNNKSEEQHRLQNWLETKQMIDNHNAEALEGKHSYLMELNHLSDRTEEEMNNLLGTVVPSEARDAIRVDFTDMPQERQLPTSIDLRTNKCLSPVKNQLSCGSCWAFSAIASLEYVACIKSGVAVQLSEQQLVDCSSSNSGCNGGFYTTAWSDMKSRGGVATSASYPYKATVNTCPSNLSPAVQVSTSTLLASKSESAIKAALVNGPVSVAINAIKSFSSYKGGVYDDPACDSTNNMNVNHAVTIVGYGDLNGIPYWIVRNSWGATWGSSGYILFRRGVNRCNIEVWPGVVTV